MGHDKDTRLGGAMQRRAERGRRLAYARRCRGWGPDRLAAAAGVGETRLAGHEAGTHDLTADQLAAVAAALGLPLWFLFATAD